MRKPFLLLITLCSVVLGCDGVGGGLGPEAVDEVIAAQDSAAAFRTDARSYTLQASSVGFEGKIGFTFTNPADSPVYIVNCNGSTSLRMEKRVGDAWIPAWAPVIPLCLSPPIVIQPGMQYSGTVNVFAGYPSNNLYPKFHVSELRGVYRLVWGSVFWSFDARGQPFGEAVPVELRTSNRFAIAVA